MEWINLMSDTVTKPTPPMLEAMFKAEVGDDVFGEDPTVNALQAYAAELFGKEAALFCPSGTMTNQIALKVHTQPLQEIICDINSHIYQYEVGGFAFHSQASIQLIQGVLGKITAEQIQSVIKADQDWLAQSKLVVLENSCNKAGGSYYTLPEIDPITNLCRSRSLALHLDGARIFNVLIETGETPQAVGNRFDSISVCLSKGLGAPVGSLLIGDKSFIKQARRVRKVMGGGMRQAGYLAAAGLYALQHHVVRLKEDHDHARQLGNTLETLSWVESVAPVQTNIVIFTVRAPLTAGICLSWLLEQGIKAVSMGERIIRFVTHLDINPDMVNRAINALERSPDLEEWIKRVSKN